MSFPVHTNGVTGVRDMGSDSTRPVLRNDINRRTPRRPALPSGPMLDGPKPRFPSSIAIATPADAVARRRISSVRRGFHQAAIAHPARSGLRHRQGSQKTKPPVRRPRADSVRASEMSAAGMKSLST